MTLEELISEFLSEAYDFFKYRDKDGNEIMVRLYFSSHREFLEQYMKYYREQPSLAALLEDATLGVIKIDQRNQKSYLIRHPHQEVFTDYTGDTRGIPISVARQVESKLLSRISDLENCETFQQIVDIVEQSRVSGFGELAIYDTAVRIGAYLGIAPNKVYLHAGTREGIKALEEKGYLMEGSYKRKTIGVNELPKEFKRLTADEIQNCLCEKKEKIKRYIDIRKNLFSELTTEILKGLPETYLESAKLYENYRDVARVAKERGYAESTIYKHLFRCKVLNPHDFILDEEIDKVNYLRHNHIDGNIEKIDEILSAVAKKAAFFYLTKRGE